MAWNGDNKQTQREQMLVESHSTAIETITRFVFFMERDGGGMTVIWLKYTGLELVALAREGGEVDDQPVAVMKKGGGGGRAASPSDGWAENERWRRLVSYLFRNALCRATNPGWLKLPL
jgi:hypothetical protein